ncbi:hypothetical protein [Streptomyces sp. NPDC048340]|uniref:hypothetical protein n=1 Tax=Streptomyces sp. NPDC048340 TaxID=3365537 RepID=UPI0037206457
MCAAPEGEEGWCSGCRWQMYGDLVLGELTEKDKSRAAAALQAAGRAWDLRAAALCGDGGGGPEAGGGISTVVRGGPPGPGEDARRAPAGPADLPPTLPDEILDDLIFGRVKELRFLELTPDHMNVIKVHADENGIPRHMDAGCTEWRSVVPALDRRPDIRRFQLAGGIGELSPVSRGEFDAAVLHWLTASAPASPGRPVVLLTRHSGWTLLDRAAATARATCAPQAELGRGSGAAAGTTTAQAVRELLRTAPLLVDHTLLLARADRRTGAVDVQSHVLFPAGARLRPGGSATATVTVHGGTTDNASVLLPVLAGAPAVGHPGSGGPGGAVLSVRRTALGALEPARLTFVLQGPGEVGLVGPGGSPQQEERTVPDLPALLRGLPRRIVRPPLLEVFCTVELSGANDAETEERLAFVRDLITALARNHGTGKGLRTGVIGHYDHSIHENGYAPRGVLLMPPVPAGPAEQALAVLKTWRPARRRQDTVSSLEDALQGLVPLAAAPARGDEAVRRIVLIVARRPPAPPRQHGMVPPCPLGADWRIELDRLRGADVQVMTRADPATGSPPGEHARAAVRRYEDAAWAALSRDGSFRPGTDSAADVARAMGPPRPSDGPPCPLAFATPLH